MTTVRLAAAGDAEDLDAYLHRLLRYDARAVVRVLGRGRVLGVVGRPPFDVLALRSSELAEESDADVTVSAGQLADAVVRSRAGGDAAPEIVLPAPVTAPLWTVLLPPWEGWQHRATLLASDVAQAVSEGVAAFRERSAALPDDERGRQVLDRIAADVWNRLLAGDVPLRAAHAAAVLGFLRPHGDVTVHEARGWLRLDAAYGSVTVRRPIVPVVQLP